MGAEAECPGLVGVGARMDALGGQDVLEQQGVDADAEVEHRDSRQQQVGDIDPRRRWQMAHRGELSAADHHHLALADPEHLGLADAGRDLEPVDQDQQIAWAQLGERRGDGGDAPPLGAACQLDAGLPEALDAVGEREAPHRRDQCRCHEQDAQDQAAANGVVEEHAGSRWALSSAGL